MPDIKNVSFQSALPVDDQFQLQKQQRLAQMLQQQAMQPIEANQVVSGRVVPVGWAQGLNKLAQGYFAGQAEDKAGALARELVGKQQQARQATIDGMQGVDQDTAIKLAMQSSDPVLQQMGLSMWQKKMMPENVVVGRSLLNKQNGAVVGQDATWQAEQEAARAQKMDELKQKSEDRQREIQMKLEDARTSRAESAALRRELAGMASADRRMIAGMVQARQEQKNTPKLPTPALRMQQEELDAIGTASGINADMAALEKQIDEKKLQLGPVNNLMAKAKNALGASDEQSRNFASFNSTLEKMRNDSLRLNKGVQTEGDAQRAWNELIANANDPQVVKQRLQEIRSINDRAVKIRQMNVEHIRSNFGVEPLETEKYQNQPAAVGNSKPAANGAYDDAEKERRYQAWKASQK